MSVSLSKYSLDELQRLLAQISSEIERQEHVLAVAESAAQAEPEPVAAAPGAAEAESVPAVEAAVAVAEVLRFAHPANRALRWSGVEPAPHWVTAYLARGGSLSAMENAADQLREAERKRALLRWPQLSAQAAEEQGNSG